MAVVYKHTTMYVRLLCGEYIYCRQLVMLYMFVHGSPHSPPALPLSSGVSIAILDHYECVGWENLSMYCKVQSSVVGGTQSPGLYTVAGVLCASTSMMLIMFCCCRLWRRWWIPSGYEQDDRSINRTLLNAKTSIGRSLIWLRYGITGLYSDYFGMDRGKWFWKKMYVFNSSPKAVNTSLCAPCATTLTRVVFFTYPCLPTHVRRFVSEMIEVGVQLAALSQVAGRQDVWMVRVMAAGIAVNCCVAGFALVHGNRWLVINFDVAIDSFYLVWNLLASNINFGILTARRTSSDGEDPASYSAQLFVTASTADGANTTLTTKLTPNSAAWESIVSVIAVTMPCFYLILKCRSMVTIMVKLNLGVGYEKKDFVGRDAVDRRLESTGRRCGTLLLCHGKCVPRQMISRNARSACRRLTNALFTAFMVLTGATLCGIVMARTAEQSAICEAKLGPQIWSRVEPKVLYSRSEGLFGNMTCAFSLVRRLNLRGLNTTHIPPALAEFRSLEVLDLSGVRLLSDGDFDIIARLPHLKNLTLREDALLLLRNEIDADATARYMADFVARRGPRTLCFVQFGSDKSKAISVGGLLNRADCRALPRVITDAAAAKDTADAAFALDIGGRIGGSKTAPFVFLGRLLAAPKAIGGNNVAGQKSGCVMYTVVKGDSLTRIAKRFDIADWKMIYQLNKGTMSDENTLDVGQKLLLPGDCHLVINKRSKSQLPVQTLRDSTATTLILKNKDLSDDDATVIAEIVRLRGTNLTVVELQHNKIGDRGAAHLARILEPGGPRMLVKLDLSHNNIGGAGGTAIFDALLAHDGPLEELKLTNNNATSLEIPSVLGPIADRLLARRPKGWNSTALESLLPSVGSSSAVAHRGGTNLQYLSLVPMWTVFAGSGSTPGKQSTVVVLKSTSSSHRLLFATLMFNTDIDVLEFDDNEIQDGPIISATVEAIGIMLSFNKAITHLSISRGAIAGGAGLILRGLAANPHSALLVLDLTYNKIGYGGALKVAEFLASPLPPGAVAGKELRLYLRGNNLTDAGAARIGQALGTGSVRLRGLDISLTGCGDEGCLALAGAYRRGGLVPGLSHGICMTYNPGVTDACVVGPGGLGNGSSWGWEVGDDKGVGYGGCIYLSYYANSISANVLREFVSPYHVNSLTGSRYDSLLWNSGSGHFERPAGKCWPCWGYVE